MEKNKSSFGWLVIARAWQGTLETFDTTWRAILLAVILALASLGVQWAHNGLAAMKQDLGQTLWQTALPIGIVGLAILLWNLWLAPAALAFEAAQAALRAQSTASAGAGGSVYSLIDNDTRKLGGRLGLLGEVISRYGFAGFRSNSVDEMYFNDILKSTHPIWTKPKPRQLRRDFENQTGAIIHANKARDANERTLLAAEFARTVDALSSILLGDAPID